MKITYIIDGLGIGGAERMLLELATRVDARVEVISLSRTEQTQDTAKLLEDRGIRVTRIPKRSKLGFGLVQELKAHLSQSQPDVVHTHLFAADVWGERAARALKIPSVSTEHSVNRDEGWLKHRLKSAGHKRRAAVVAVSPAVERYVREVSAHDPNTRVITNGVDTERFSPERRAPRENHLLVVGRLEPAKGHTNLLRALPHVQAHVTVEVVGDGSLRDDLEKLTHKLGLEERVHFVGATTDVAGVYDTAVLTVIPSNWEGQGIVALEAMASGCPVVASDVDGLRDVIDAEKTGVLVDTTDPEEFARTLDRVLGDDTLQKNLSQTARTRVQKEFSVQAMVQSYQQLYEDIADQ